MISELRNKVLFPAIEGIGFILIYLGFKTTGVESVVLGVIGLLVVVVSAGYFTRCKQTTNQTSNSQQQSPN
ncbi:hypothetical protein [Stygiolobus azoricus]|uniref:Uncharacterized protein n=1 Tax=Stygiolobus azoricus TaxID=41675 RepID=A0A650CN85_9CREN|nr:hypothetical protein [Stygiolobus azoricus]QGR19145.1 hypothetical protein D1868_03575 [Stygiolobus azoricus]